MRETLGGKPVSAYLLDPNAPTTDTVHGSADASAALLPNAKSLKPRSITRTMNYIPYFTDNTDNSGNSLLYQTGGYIGIGATNPLGNLHISTPGQLHLRLDTPASIYTDLSRGGAVKWQYGLDDYFGTAGLFVYDNVNAKYAFGINASTGSLLLQSTRGNVGIGATMPSEKLHLSNGNIQMDSASGSTVGSIFFGGTTFNGQVGMRLFGGLVNGCREQQSRRWHRIRVDNSGRGTERMRITNTGNLGIGTTTPTASWMWKGILILRGIYFTLQALYSDFPETIIQPSVITRFSSSLVRTAIRLLVTWR